MIKFPGLLFAFVLGLPSFVEAQPTSLSSVVTAYFSERPPFSMVEGQTGILITLTKAILSEAGIRARFIELPGPRIVEMLRIGQTDALGVGWYGLPGKAPVGRFSLPIYQELPMVAVLNARTASVLGPTPRLDTLLASPFTLGLKAGTSLGPLLDQMVRAQGIVPLETGVSVAALLRLVLAGRMDYTLLSGEEAQYLLKGDPSLVPGVVMVRLADAPPGNFRYFLYPEGFDPVLADRIDSAIERLTNMARSPATARPLIGGATPLVDPPAPRKP